jgi:hypothetical protein
MAGRLAPASKVAGSRTYLNIFKLADHALIKIVWYVLLQPLRLELDGRPLSANFSYSRALN